MALLYTSPPALPVHRRLRPLDPLPLLTPTRLVRHRFLFLCPNPSPFLSATRAVTRGFAGAGLASFRLCEHENLPPLNLDSLVIKECESDDELMAAVRLRVRTFYVEFEQSSGSDDQRRDLEEREFSALKDRIDGKRIGFKRVSCINATLPLSASLVHADELCTECKFSQNGEDRVVVASLDINQCLKLADELTGRRPEAPGAGVVRAYLSNVCVAEELQRNGLGYAIVAKSKADAHSWGINDLYVHVAVDNEAAKRLYSKSGFVYENEEPTWQARFLGRPRRFLLWADLSQISS